MTKLDPAFGHWLAGFTDGEGCFRIDVCRHENRVWCHCEFSINLRSDDGAILREIQQQLGVGKVRQKSVGGNSKPQLVFVVHDKFGCLVVRDAFRAFPLRAKKNRDFTIWSEALDLWLDHKPGDSWEEIILLNKHLATVREFKEEENA